jgi:hypothetical protein
MKKSKDGKEIPDRCWYYLLAFNDRDNWETIERLFGTKRLSDLTMASFAQLFEIAGKQDSHTLLTLK